MKQVHELAKFFPPMPGDEFSALCQDVKNNGLINPIMLKDDKILDGVNRAKACEKTGTRPKYEKFNGGDPLEYVISQNVLRRHLTTSQRAVLALELEKKFSEEPPLKGADREKSIGAKSLGKSLSTKQKDQTPAGRAANAMHVRPDIVYQAKRVAKAAPHMLKDIRDGKITVREALVSNLDRRARERAIKVKNDETRKRLQTESRQVAQFFEAVKAFKVALKLAYGDRERFSKEAVRFTKTRLDDIRNLMTELEDSLKKGS